VSGRARTTATWLGVGACAVYAVFAFDVGVDVLLSADAPARSAPPLFVLHAFGGGIALVAGPLQLALAPRVLARAPRLHRVLGRVYAGAACVTAVAGLGTAVAFDVGLAGTLAFAAWALLWLGATSAALVAVRRGRITRHRAWMVRSVALSLVFAVFSVVQPALLDAGFGRAAAYPLAVLGSVALVLACSRIGLRGRAVAAAWQ
jgi:uncharacterized membrane protein